MGIRCVSTRRALTSGVLLGCLGILFTLVGAVPAHAAPLPPGGLTVSGSAAGNPLVSWQRSATATSYDVELDDSADFSSPLVAQRTVNNRFVPTQSLPTGVLHVRVRATSSSGASGWARGQTQIAPTPPPVALSPVDGESLSQPNRPPLLQWQPVAGAVGYDIEVDSDGNWIDQATYTSKGASFTLPDPQAPGAWQWRVRAQRGGGLVTQWSTPADYEVEPLTAVSVLGPAGSERVQDVVLAWEPVAGASKYEVRIGRDQGFSNTVEVVTVAGTRYSPATTYLNDGYFWQVRPIDQAGRKLAWPTEAPSTFVREWPQKPTLLHPADRIDLPVGDSFYYQWSPVPHATRYQLDVGSDPNFSPTTYSTCTTAGTTYTAGYLTPSLAA
ncbi:hypothetical protein, partial [Nocardioides sp.]|uniref:hypothetical protein n=1 Tax=Nocardioides sp. TaxID=35761 RepID=UPI002732BE78